MRGVSQHFLHPCGVGKSHETETPRKQEAILNLYKIKCENYYTVIDNFKLNLNYLIQKVIFLNKN